MDQIQTDSYARRLHKRELKDSCPFWSTQGCKLEPIPCGYGLTEVKVPDGCPLRSGSAVKLVTLIEGTDGRR